MIKQWGEESRNPTSSFCFLLLSFVQLDRNICWNWNNSIWKINLIWSEWFGCYFNMQLALNSPNIKLSNVRIGGKGGRCGNIGLQPPALERRLFSSGGVLNQRSHRLSPLAGGELTNPQKNPPDKNYFWAQSEPTEVCCAHLRQFCSLSFIWGGRSAVISSFIGGIPKMRWLARIILAIQGPILSISLYLSTF